MKLIDLDSERRSRNLYVGLWLAGGLALGISTALGKPLVGAGSYALGVIAAMVVWYRYPGKMFDERDSEVHRKASGQTLTLIGYASAVFFPALTAASGLGYYTWSPASTTTALLVAGIYLLYGLNSYRVEN